MVSLKLVSALSIGINIFLIGVIFGNYQFVLMGVNDKTPTSIEKVKNHSSNDYTNAHCTASPLMIANRKFFSLIGTTPSDKFHHHHYEWAFYKYLYPHSFGKPKMLEIGLGCGMYYGPGASIPFWLRYFNNNVDLWIFEYDKVCVEAYRKDNRLPNVKIVIGDQANKLDLARLVKQSGGEFDIIVDDGGHSVAQQTTTLKFLFPHLKSGGTYFLEDLERQQQLGTYTYLLERLILHGWETPRNGSGKPIIDPSYLRSMECFITLCVFNKL